MADERTYNSLADIERQRRHLKNELAANERVVARLWKDIFHKPKNRRFMSRSQRLTGLLTSSVSVVDALLLAWKLYRKFKR